MQRLTWVLYLTTLFFANQFIKAETKTNLIWIITDEHNFRTLGCYRDQLSPDQAFVWGEGNEVKTPNIDMLAEYGTLFDRMYASTPVCTPSRASMFTGEYAHNLGMPNNSSKVGDGKYLKPDVPTIGEILLNNGYETGYGGKWHLAEKTDPDEFWQPYPVGKPRHNYGFKHNKYMFNGGHDKWKGIDANGNPYRANPKNSPATGTDIFGQPVYKDSKSDSVKFTTDWLTDRALAFFSENKEKPFFYVLSIPDPHTPNTVRAPYNTMYTDLDIELPNTFYNNNEGKGDSWRKPSKTEDTLKLKQDVQQYFGMVKCIDDNVGRILTQLENDGVLENTIILFTSDHGDMLGEHARVNKNTIHEASAKVPFVLMHGKNLVNPIIPRGKVVREAGNTCDWMPTFLKLLDVPCPDVAGKDLTPLLAQKIPVHWNDVTIMRKGYIAAVDSRYKLYVANNNETWLFDIEQDPDENINYIDDPKYFQIAKKLALDIKSYMQLENDGTDYIHKELDKILARETVDHTALNETYKANVMLQIYPNPAKNQVMVASEKGANIALYSVSGRLIQQVIKSEEALVQFSLAGINRGSYVIQSTSKKGIICKKFTKL